MLTHKQFAVMNTIRATKGIETQKELAEASGLSVGTVNSVIRDAVDRKWVDQTTSPYRLTDQGIKALAPYKVDNAIIMAAGLSTRFAPISYEKPKGVLVVRGEVLVERQIRQLHEAGIHDITLVVGYKKEEFFYLADKLDVDIVVNEEYATRNNNGTLYKVRDRLKNTYICSSDNYFTSNVFEPYVYEAYYPGVYVEGPTNEWCMQTGNHERIVKVTYGLVDAWTMSGHAYFDRRFSQRFVSILHDVYDLPETRDKLWEEIFIDHIRELPMVMRRYDGATILEFDSLAELQAFDSEFIDNVDSSIIDNICAILGCARRDICNITPIKQGLTNLSFSFDVGATRYVYRHPGPGTAQIINRESETYAQQMALDLGIDDTFIYEDAGQGWKISRFIDGCIPFDYHNPAHVREGLALGRKLHDAHLSCEWTFDIHAKAEQIIGLLGSQGRTSFSDFEKMHERADAISTHVGGDGVAPCLCHDDFYAPNFLVGTDRMRLIDWEYAGLSDYASDLGTFICCSDYTYEQAMDALEIYFGRVPSAAETRHCVGYVALAAWYWFVWAIYQDMSGKPVGEYLYIWYRFANEYGMRAIELYAV